MEKQNICKFITTQDPGQLRVYQFFFESIVPHSGEERTLHVHCMHLVSGGAGRYRCADEYRTLTPGCLFFSFADIPGIIENTGELQYYCIGFSGGRAEELFQRFGVTPRHCLFTGCEGLLPLWEESLARASAGKDEKRALRAERRLPLLGIQGRKVGSIEGCLGCLGRLRCMVGLEKRALGQRHMCFLGKISRLQDSSLMAARDR